MNKKILIVFIVLLVILCGYVFYSSNNNSLNISSKNTEELSTKTQSPFEYCMANGGVDKTPNYNAPRICALDNKAYSENCVSNDKYFVVSKDVLGSVGSDILIKHKSSPKQNISCEYNKSNGDLEILDNESASYILALEGNYLLIDSGTGPDPRGLSVYDITKGKIVFSDKYSQPVDIKNNSISYWAQSSEEANPINCPKYNEYKGFGGSAVITAHVSLNLSNLTKTDLGEKRCSYQQ